MGENKGVVLSLDSEGKIETANGKFFEVFGFPKEEVIGKPIDNFIVSGQDSHLPQHLEHAVSIPIDAALRTHWNTTLKTKIIPQHDAVGFDGIRQYQITFLDAPAKHDLSLSNPEIFQKIFEQAAVGVALVAPEGRVLKANSTFQESLGYTEEELKSLTFQEFTHKDDLAKDEAYYRQLNAGEIDQFQMEKRYITKDQRVIWVNLSVSLMRDYKNRMMYAIAVVQDIDQRKRMDIELQLHKSRLEKAVSGSREAVWHWLNVNSDEEWWSPAFYEILGYPLNSLDPTYTTFLKLLHPHDHAKVNEAVTRHLEDDIDFDINYRLKKSDGKYKWVNAKGKAERDETGKPTEMIGIISDIEHIKKAELLLESRNSELEKSNRELENFAYVASHDLQEPLRTISSFLQLFRLSIDFPLSEEASSYLDTVHNASLRMRKLIEDLLEYSRVGRKMKLENVDMLQLIEEVKADLTAQLTLQNGSIEIENVLNVRGDRNSLYRLFKNIMTNAVKFTEPDLPPQVRIGAELKKSRVHFWISDNGIGIEKDYHHKIFEVFKRLHARDEYPGSGIGLSICKKVVDLHKGKIRVESTKQGSIFHFDLPKQK